VPVPATSADRDAMPNLASSNVRVPTVERIIEVPRDDTDNDASAMSGYRVLESRYAERGGHHRSADPSTPSRLLSRAREVDEAQASRSR
jgi:hypothetical protein